MKLSELILALYDELSSVIMVKPLLHSINRDLLDKIEDEAITDTFLQDRIKKMNAALIGITISHGPKWRDLYSNYKEAEIYIGLKSQIIISAIPESKETGKKTPDFEIKFRDKSYYAELKSLLAMNADLFYHSIDEQGLEGSIKREEALKESTLDETATGSTDQIIIHTTEITLAPHRKDATYDPRSKRQVIEHIINKIENNYKSDQYEMGPTISIIDISQLGLISPKHLSLLPIHSSFDVQQPESYETGELWHIAFGVENQIIFRRPDFNGKSNFDGNAKRIGILNTHENVKALIFYSDFHGRTGSFYGLYRSNLEPEMKELINRICDENVNDEQNTNFYRLHKKKSDFA